MKLISLFLFNLIARLAKVGCNSHTDFYQFDITQQNCGQYMWDTGHFELARRESQSSLTNNHV